jgi:hypothetical protein
LASCASVCRLRQYRVDDRGNDRGGSGPTQAARRLEVLNDVDLDGWRLVDAQHLVRIEIGLFDMAAFECDLAMERRRDAEDRMQSSWLTRLQSWTSTDASSDGNTGES